MNVNGIEKVFVKMVREKGNVLTVEVILGKGYFVPFSVSLFHHKLGILTTVIVISIDHEKKVERGKKEVTIYYLRL